MIVAGNGVQQSGAYEELRLLAERLGVPVVTSLGARAHPGDARALASARRPLLAQLRERRAAAKPT